MVSIDIVRPLTKHGVAETIVKLLKKCVFRFLGVREQIHMDQDGQFKLGQVAKLCAFWEMQKSHTTPYHLCSMRWLNEATETLVTCCTQCYWGEVGRIGICYYLR